jgi:uncharacterized protein with HEPN domain
MSKRDETLLFEDVLEAIGRIREYTRGYSKEDFFRDQKTIDAVIRNLEIIGEACGQVPGPVRERYPQIPWRKIVGVRNIAIHHNFGVDLETVWFIITRQLPDLQSSLRAILARRETED